MADIELYLEAERRGILPENKVTILNEMRRRGMIPSTEKESTTEDEIKQEQIVSPIPKLVTEATKFGAKPLLFPETLMRPFEKRGREVKESVQSVIERATEAPIALKEPFVTSRGLTGGVAATALEFAPFTPSEFSQNIGGAIAIPAIASKGQVGINLIKRLGSKSKALSGLKNFAKNVASKFGGKELKVSEVGETIQKEAEPIVSKFRQRRIGEELGRERILKQEKESLVKPIVEEKEKGLKLLESEKLKEIEKLEARKEEILKLETSTRQEQIRRAGKSQDFVVRNFGESPVENVKNTSDYIENIFKTREIIPRTLTPEQLQVMRRAGASAEEINSLIEKTAQIEQGKLMPKFETTNVSEFKLMKQVFMDIKEAKTYRQLKRIRTAVSDLANFDNPFPTGTEKVYRGLYRNLSKDMTDVATQGGFLDFHKSADDFFEESMKAIRTLKNDVRKKIRPERLESELRLKEKSKGITNTAKEEEEVIADLIREKKRLLPELELSSEEKVFENIAGKNPEEILDYIANENSVTEIRTLNKYFSEKAKDSVKKGLLDKIYNESLEAGEIRPAFVYQSIKKITKNPEVLRELYGKDYKYIEALKDISELEATGLRTNLSEDIGKQLLYRVHSFDGLRGIVNKVLFPKRLQKRLDRLLSPEEASAVKEIIFPETKSSISTKKSIGGALLLPKVKQREE